MARREYQDPTIKTGGTARKYYYIRYRRKVLVRDASGHPKIERRERQHNLGWCDEVTRREAQRMKADLMRDVNRECYTIQSHIPFCEFLDLWEKEHFRSIRDTTATTYRQWLTNHVRPAFAGKKLFEVDTLEITRFFHMLEDGGVAKTTRRSMKGMMSAIFKRARQWKYVTEDPVTDAEVGGGPDRVREKRIPSRAEIQMLLEAVDDQTRLLIETLMYTGMRISEALGLRWKNVDLEHGVVFIRERQSRGRWGEPKCDPSRRVLPLVGLTDRFREWHGTAEPDTLVFRDEQGAELHDNELLANYVTRKMVKLGIKYPGFGWHTFRRLCLTWMDQEGASAFDVMAQAGHTKPGTTALYVVPDVARREEFVRRMQERMTIQ